ncbi:MAG: transglutaminase family protein [Hyphomicrobiales bacterium]|nr:transglutaminase family protein [Hyphomicrobiales bacterium]
MIFELSHKTVYRYTAPVAQSHHLIHLAPRPADRQTVSRHTIIVEPAPAARTDFVDAFGNPATILTIEQDHSELLIHSRGQIEVTARPKPDLTATVSWSQLAAELGPGPGPHDLDLLQYACSSRYARPARDAYDYARESFPQGRPVLEGAMDLTSRIYTDFKYDPKATDVATSVSELLRIRRGVCQDFAHLAISGLRSLGLPARYVSGYLLTHPPAGQPRLQGADASHAWISVWAPETGWVDFDPTNNLIPSDEHITIAYGRDYHDVSPIAGVLLGGGEHKMDVAVDVVPV